MTTWSANSDDNFSKVIFPFQRWPVHDGVIKWKYFPRNWPFVRWIHRSPVNSPHKGQWRGALMFALICVWINGWVNNSDAGDLRRHRAHCDVIVMITMVATSVLVQLDPEPLGERPPGGCYCGQPLGALRSQALPVDEAQAPEVALALPVIAAPTWFPVVPDVRSQVWVWGTPRRWDC